MSELQQILDMLQRLDAKHEQLAAKVSTGRPVRRVNNVILSSPP